MMMSWLFFRENFPGLFKTAKIGLVLLMIGCVVWLWTGDHDESIVHNKKVTKATIDNKTEPAPAYKEVGEASWYGPRFQDKETASGETFDSNKLTAAHPSLPLGTKVEVTNLKNDKKVAVKITDRGPYAKGRVIDLSAAAARKLRMVKKGTTKVKIVAKTNKRKIAKRHPTQKRKSHSHKKSLP